MRARLSMLLIVCAVFQICGQETFAAFEKAIIRTWEFTKTEVVDRGGGGTYFSNSKDEIIIGNKGQVQFIKQDTSWTEIYELTTKSDFNQVRFQINCYSLSGDVVFKDDDTMMVSRYFGGCGPVYFYERKEMKINTQ